MTRALLALACVACTSRPTLEERAFVAQQQMPRYDGTTRCRADPAATAATSPGARGTRAHDEIHRGVMAARRRLELCFQRQVARGLSGGRVFLEMQIEADGTVRDLLLQGFDPTLDECLCRVLVGLRFGTAEGEVHVRFPLLFNHNG